MYDRHMEVSIINGLLHSERFRDKVLSQVKDEYFKGVTTKMFIQEILNYYSEYRGVPDVETLGYLMSKRSDLHSMEKDVAADIIKQKEVNVDWLYGESEKHVRRVRSYDACNKCSKEFQKPLNDFDIANALVELQQANSHVWNIDNGLDFTDCANELYEFNTAPQSFIPFNLWSFDRATGGGGRRKTVACGVAGTNVGKTVVLCNIAELGAKNGLNVVYISMEESKFAIANRCLAKISKNNIAQINQILPEMIEDSTNEIIEAGGSLNIFEFPTGSAHCGHFRTVLKNLECTKGIKIDLVCLDYLNIAALASNRKVNDSYTIVKETIIEFRALMQEFDCFGLTMTQTNREGQESDDILFSHVAESHGLAQNVDYMFGIMRNKAMEAKGIMKIKQLKSRYGNKDKLPVFNVGCDIDKMTIYDLDDYAVEDESDGVTNHFEVEAKVIQPVEKIDREVLNGSTKVISTKPKK